MLGELVSLILLVFLLNKFYHFVFGKPTANVPPGLPRLPIWGSYWILLWGDYKYPHRMIQYYAEKYKSKIISLWLGDYFTVVATSYESIKELLSKKQFDGRLTDADVAKARAFEKKLGVFFIDGPSWKEQRRFALRHLRDFGFGRRMDKVESDYAEELGILLDTMKNGPINDEERTLIKGDKIYFPDILYPIAANFFLTIFAGERSTRNDHDKLRAVARSAGDLQRHSDTTGGAILMTPWVRHFGDGFGYQGLVKGSMGITNFLAKYLHSHKDSFIEEAERGFLDTYIKKLKESDTSSTFSEEQLLVLGTDFAFPALSANPWMTTIFIKYMLHYPHIMKKVQEEIDTVVGRDRLITLDDRVNLPYTEATIREVMRADTMTPWSIAHRAMEEDSLCGFDIPENTVLITDLYSMHHDPEFWGDPENLRPERFLTEDGKLGKDYTLPFGAGGRLCAGETFARQFIFLASATMAQNFDFEFIDGQPNGLKDRIQGFAMAPMDLWMKVIPRK